MEGRQSQSSKTGGGLRNDQLPCSVEYQIGGPFFTMEGNHILQFRALLAKMGSWLVLWGGS